VTQEEGPLEIEIGDSGIQPNLLPGVPSGWTDALTGTDGPRLWDRTVSSEVARVSRYRRPVTVALIEINGLDRPGLLYDVTREISDLNLDIASAHIATFGEKAVDVFYVTDLTGKKITSKSRESAIRDRLLKALQAAQDAPLVPA